MRVQRMPMHLSPGQRTLMLEKIFLSTNFSQSDLGRRTDSRWALLQISSFFFPARNLRDACADQREILYFGQY